MKLFVALVVFGLLASVQMTVMHDPFYCFSTDPIRSMNHLMGAYSSYEATRRFNFTTVEPYTPNGSPSRFWYLGRNAARFPHPQYIIDMTEFVESAVEADIFRNYEAGRTTLCRPDFEAIRDFNIQTEFENEFTMENVFMIMKSGIIATQSIARRFQQAIPNIFPETYSPERFHFRHTIEERTNITIRAFVYGLFGDAGSQNVIYEDVPDVDWLMKPFNYCPAFSEGLDYNAISTAFTEGPEFEEMIEQVNRRLGFISSNQLSFDQILSMWNFCRFKLAETFETSNSETGGNATWCAAFSIAHHHLFQYYTDLTFFYASGYGIRNQRMLENLSCGLMQDLLIHMRSNNIQTARIFITLPRQVLGMLVLLGSFRDVWPLHQHNFAQQSNRRWLTSFIGQFNANLVVVRYDSDDGDHDLIFLLNEKPMLVPGCDQQTGVCKLSVLENRFQRFINANCEEFFCSND